MLTLIAAFLISSVLLRRFLRWCRAVPEAHAWDPNSHEKMASYALDLLADPTTDPKTTLLGWALQVSRTRATDFRSSLELQIRRGSIEEDMNSYMLPRFIFTWGKVDGLEGANGGYHFFNPKRPTMEAGLTDPTWLLWLVGTELSHCKTPMPSAVQRAYAPPGMAPDQGWFSTPWHLDTESRNYSVGDAVNYGRLGYPHLASYAIGRVCHLLQDMTVPAHVRDDAHPGSIFQNYGFDPSDPLEVYADPQDKAAEPGSGHRWSFDPGRSYALDIEIYPGAQSKWQEKRDQYGGIGESLFKDLALDTYNTHYSYNTIPGNGNSHNPDNTATAPWLGEGSAGNTGALRLLYGAGMTPYPLDRALHWTKCAPSSDGVYGVLLRFFYDAEKICIERAMALGLSAEVELLRTTERATAPGQDLATGSPEVESLRRLEDSVRVLRQVLLPVQRQKLFADIDAKDDRFRTDQEGNIIGICPQFGLDTARLRAALPPILEICRHSEVAVQDSDRSIAYLTRFNQLHLPLLAEHAGLEKKDGAWALGPDPGDINAILTGWIDGHPAPAELAAAFSSDDPFYRLGGTGAPEANLNGPYCLTRQIIEDQWKECQTRAVAYTAILLSNWFETLYADPPDRAGMVFNQPGKLALGLWLNQDAGDDETTPAVSSSAPVNPVPAGWEPDPLGVTAQKAATLGLSNGLPVPIDLTIEIELIEDGTDEDLWESGVDLKLCWEHLRCTTPRPDAGKSIFDVPDGARDTPPPVSGETAQLPVSGWERLGTFRLGGENPVSYKITLADASPNNLEALARVKLPPGTWSPSDTHMGGITREDEAAQLTPIPDVPGQDADANARMSPCFLRLVLQVPPDTQAPQTAQAPEGS